MHRSIMPAKKRRRKEAMMEKNRRRKEAKMEKTFVMIKPDGVQRRLIPEIIRRFEEKPFSLKGMKLMNVERGLAEKHYENLSDKKVLFRRLVDYIVSSGPVVAMIWEGKNVVETVGEMIGPLSPSDCDAATIRRDFGIDKIRNVIHGSDSVDIANKEIALWFPEGPLNWDPKINNYWNQFDC